MTPQTNTEKGVANQSAALDLPLTQAHDQIYPEDSVELIKEKIKICSNTTAATIQSFEVCCEVIAEDPDWFVDGDEDWKMFGKLRAAVTQLQEEGENR